MTENINLKGKRRKEIIKYLAIVFGVALITVAFLWSIHIIDSYDTLYQTGSMEIKRYKYKLDIIKEKAWEYEITISKGSKDEFIDDLDYAIKTFSGPYGFDGFFYDQMYNFFESNYNSVVYSSDKIGWLNTDILLENIDAKTVKIFVSFCVGV